MDLNTNNPLKNMGSFISKRTIAMVILGIVVVIAFTTLNPFSWNDAGNRTVVERMNGEQIVQFAPGIFYAGFFAKQKEWPNQISVMYQAEGAKLEFEDNGIEVGHIMIRFSDATTANVKGYHAIHFTIRRKRNDSDSQHTPYTSIIGNKTTGSLYEGVFAVVCPIDE